MKETWENKLEAWREYEIVDAFFIAIILSYQLLIHLHHLIFIIFANKGFSFIFKDSLLGPKENQTGLKVRSNLISVTLIIAVFGEWIRPQTKQTQSPKTSVLNVSWWARRKLFVFVHCDWNLLLWLSCKARYFSHNSNFCPLP